MKPDVEGLLALDPVFARCLETGGPLPEFRLRAGGFPALLRLIIEQQLSTIVAERLWQRLLDQSGSPTPAFTLALGDDDLKACGFSRQKIGYARHLASAVQSGQLDPDTLPGMSDEDVITTLTALKGIGRWTAEIYLMQVLGRPDVWPAGDLALQVGVQWLRNWQERPSAARIMHEAESWRPHRSLAARLIWHHYLAVRTTGQARPLATKP